MQIHWTHCTDLADDERQRVEARLRALAKENDDLIDIRVVGHTTNHHRHGAQSIRITCMARGQEIVAARERAELSLALNDALDAFEREVRKLRDKRNSVR